MSKLEQNTTSLDEVLAMVNALPDAGGGGGGSVDTCSLRIAANASKTRVECTTLSGGVITHTVVDPTTSSHTISNVICGSMVFIKTKSSYSNQSFLETKTTYFFTDGFGVTVTITAGPGETASFEA